MYKSFPVKLLPSSGETYHKLPVLNIYYTEEIEDNIDFTVANIFTITTFDYANINSLSNSNLAGIIALKEISMDNSKLLNYDWYIYISFATTIFYYKLHKIFWS